MITRSDLPLSRDGTSRLLPWIVGAMIYLATMAAAGGLAAGGLAKSWQTQLTGVLTVQIPPSEGASDGLRRDMAERQARIIRVLKSTPGIARTFVLDQNTAAGLLEPWLGGQILDELPLPSLIDVRLTPGADIDLDALQERLDAEVAGVRVDDHDRWLGEVLEIATLVELFGALVLFLACLVIGLSLIFSVRAAVAIHFPVIEIMHLIGARNAYIARQFQWHAFAMTFRGGYLGGALAWGTLYGLDWLLERDGLRVGARSMLSWLELTVEDWAVLASIPLVAALFALVVARLSVSRKLAALP